MSTTESNENHVTRSIEERVREGVLRSVREKDPGAQRVDFHEIRNERDEWKVAGTWPLSMRDSEGWGRQGRFNGTVKVGPGSGPGKVALDMSLEIFVPFMEFPLGGGAEKRAEGDGRTSNDQRADSLNPNSAVHRAAANNRSNQMNPNNPDYRRVRGKR
jgi:hypothetical protein